MLDNCAQQVARITHYIKSIKQCLNKLQEVTIDHSILYHLLDSLVVECWLRVREVPGSIPSQGPRHTKDVIKMVPVVPLFSTEHSKVKILALSQEL